MSSRNEDFVRAVRNLKKASDAEEIECTNFTGGGIRFVGFKSIAARQFLALLQKYGKRAIFKLDAQNFNDTQSVYADCYDNIEPQQLTACTVQELNSSKTHDTLTRSCPNHTCGAVVYASYICNKITSETVSRLLLPANVLDIHLKPSVLTLLTVSEASASIVGGLQSQLETAVRGKNQALTHKRQVKFSSGAPSVAKKTLKFSAGKKQKKVVAKSFLERAAHYLKTSVYGKT